MRSASDGRGADASINFDIDVVPTSRNHRMNLSDLGFHSRNVGLSAEPRIHGHNKNHVEQIQHVSDRCCRSGRIQRNRWLSAELANMAQGSMEMVTRFGMHDQHLTASLNVQVGKLVWLFDHQMSFEWAVCSITHRCDDIRAERQIGHEASVHHIELKAINTRLVQCDNLVAEPTEIGWKHGWDNRDGARRCHVLKLVQHYPQAVTPEPPIELHVDRMASGGEAVGRMPDGRAVFVRGALPGEKIHVQVIEQKKRFARARLISVVEPASDRIEMPCDHAAIGTCGGCDWMQVAPLSQELFKRQIVVEQLERLGHVDDPDVRMAACELGQRTTVRCSIVDGRAGYRARRSADAFAASSCRAAHVLIEELIVDGRFGDATEVTLRIGAGTNERLVITNGTTETVRVPADVTVVSAQDPGWAAIHHLVEDRSWRVSANSFFQASAEGAEALVVSVRAALAASEGPLIDLYSGVGLLGGAAAPDRLVAAVESSPSSVADARHNLSPTVSVVESKVERWKPEPCAAVIADPARRGLAKAGVAAVGATMAEHLVLVSCDPASLGRDAALLIEQGWRYDYGETINMFPDTSRIEVVSLFAR